MRILFIALATFIFGGSGLSLAMLDADQDTPESDQTQTDDREKPDGSRAILDRYAPTGDIKGCISLTQIHQSHVLSETEIFFEMRNRRGYLNTMPHRCPSLDFYKSYIHKTGINQLCNTDFITVLMGSAGRGASCGLGKFVEYERKPKD